MWVLYVSIKKWNNFIQYFLQSAQTPVNAQVLCAKILTHYFIMWNIVKVASQIKYIDPMMPLANKYILV
jgi:hypothetical protein